MQLFFIVLFLGWSITSSAQSTETFPIYYAKDSSSIIKLDDNFKTVFVFSCPSETNVDEAISLKFSLNNVSIVVPTTIQKIKKNNRTIIVGELPNKIFDTSLEGHLAFGKAMLNLLDTIDNDSIIPIQTTVNQLMQANGVLYLDCKHWPGIYEDYWNKVEQAWLLEQQKIVQDSIEKYQATTDRTESLLEASKKYVTALSGKMNTSDKELSRKYPQFSTSFESLKSINERLDRLFDNTKKGIRLTDEENKKVAFLTADASKLKRELKQSSEGKEALKVFEAMSKADSQFHSAEEQYNLTKTTHDAAENQLNFYKATAKKINKRLTVLKKILR